MVLFSVCAVAEQFRRITRGCYHGLIPPLNQEASTRCEISRRREIENKLQTHRVEDCTGPGLGVECISGDGGGFIGSRYQQVSSHAPAGGSWGRRCPRCDSQRFQHDLAGSFQLVVDASPLAQRTCLCNATAVDRRITAICGIDWDDLQVDRPNITA